MVRILNSYGSMLVTDAQARTGLGLESTLITAIDSAPDGGTFVTTQDRGKVHVAESPEEIQRYLPKRRR